MTDSTLFIADLHLNDEQPEIYQRFKEFIDNKARTARALYILGDLFEYYLGDDALSGVAQKVRQDLLELSSKHNTQCFFMAGNRDFLLANDFAKSAQLTLLTDSTALQLDNHNIVLTHGDALCTDDCEYQKIRLQLRSKQWQQWFLSQNIDERIEFAKQARIQSQAHTQLASDEIMDVNLQAVDELFAKYNTRYMIHGHTHRPAFHITDGKQRMVVGDWHYQTSYIEYKNNSFQLIAY
ncbi:MAG: UDP-2,3-diacylglucosamine diphosphatase [Proteobacteria bacterium]|nr:UDP-2,3-diacylglucosamine diphosphatase [Pseudomonadota bacterium]